MLKVTYGRRFHSDLEEIAAYLAEEAGMRTAETWVLALRVLARGLMTTPEAGAADPALGEGRRRLVVAPYLMVYELHPGEVRVLRIVHGARDLPSLFGS